MLSQLRSFYTLHYSRPKSNRPIYQAIYNSHACKIIELEIDDCRRVLRMIEVAKTASPQSPVHYVGIDRFEDREERFSEMVLSLKGAHRLFRTTGAQVQLLPGNPPEVLARAANFLGKVDLLLIPEPLDSEVWARMWFFIPRMMHPQTLVFIKRKAEGGRMAFSLKSHAEVERLAAGGAKRRAAA